MITVAELWDRLDAAVNPLRGEHVPLEQARARILRETILAPEDQPPFDRSGIDGYLVHADQSAGVVTLVGAVQPGSPSAAAPAPGTALRIFTGSALPETGVALVMQEDTAPAAANRINLLLRPSTRHIRKRGSQARAGDVLLSPGLCLGAGALALLASVGMTHPLVNRRPRIAHLITGGEIVSPDSTPASGQIRDSNSTLIAALLDEAGAERVWHRRVNDDRASTAAALAEAVASGADVVLVSGGASVGDHDHTGALLVSLGFTLHCEKVASRPGKPFIAGSRGEQLAFGLPGNPLSHFVCFHLFVKRALDRLSGTAPVSCVRATLAPDAELRTDPRETWWPCAWTDNGPQRRARPLPWRDSSDLTVLGLAEGLIRVPSSTALDAEIDVLPCR